VSVSAVRTGLLLRRLISKLVNKPRDVVPATINRINVARLEISNRIDDALRLNRGKRIVHVGIHRNGNCGDTLLFQCVRSLLQSPLSPDDWRLESVWSLFDEDRSDQVNRDAAGVVVGGGGLFLRDSNPNRNSGWQWNSTVGAIARLEIPLIVFAVGYNRFPGQEDFAPIFRDHLSAVVDKSVFFGVRNRGSIEALSEYLPSELHHRLCFQPCPTTILRQFHPNTPQPSYGAERTLALNIAFDRRQVRFGDTEATVKREVVEAMRRAVESGWKLHLAIHDKADEHICEWFSESGVPFKVARLTRASADKVMRFYAGMRFTIGMRGHSLMIPFGLGNPGISLGGHDKLGFFLREIGHPEWAVPFYEPDLCDRLVSAIRTFESNESEVRSEVLTQQKRLWDITARNVKRLEGAL
jgi:polysaccharide pyruvyl transferase WcaK-like protein